MSRRAAFAAAVALAATVERWWFSWAWREAGSLTSVFYYGDATRFIDYALAILNGRLYDNGIPYHPPGWPLVLALVFRLSGAASSGAISVHTVKLLTAVLSGLSVGVAALLAGEMAGLGAMLAVGLLGTFNFGHLAESAAANSEPLYGFLLIVAVWAAWRWLRDDATHAHAWAAMSAAAGAAAMVVRAEFLACAAMLVALAFVRGVRWTAIALYAAVFAMVLVPTTVWHFRTISAFNAAHVGRVAGALPALAPVTSYGPFNFAMANHENADGGPNRDHPMLDRCSTEVDVQLSAGQLDLACPEVYELYVNGYRIGVAWLLSHPRDASALMMRKAGMTIGFLAHGYLIDNIGAGVDGERRRVDLLDPATRVWLPIHLGLLAIGVLVLRRRPLALAVLIAPIVALVASALMFYGYVRLGVAYLPVTWILQAAAAAAIIGRVTAWRPEANTRIALVVAAMFILLAFDGLRLNVPRTVMLEGERTPSGGLVQDETLLIRAVP